VEGIEIETTWAWASPVMRVTGSIDLATAEDVIGAARTLPTASPRYVDLREVAFIDSAGARALITIAREGGGNGCRTVFIVGDSGAVRRIVEVKNLAHVIEIQEQFP
jgi:anti-anti-sigma factor